MGNTFKRNFISAAVTGALALPATTAYAQNVLLLEEVLVTARKVEESLQEVPLSISAFTVEDIKKRSLEQLEDIALATPGFSYEDYSNGGFATPIIRGASQFVVDALEQNVSTFVDGVYLPRNYAIDLGVVDMERVEVVKGPQSALYGANAFMGAVTYTTVKPNLSEFEGGVEAVLGSDGRQDLTVNVSIPLAPDLIAVKLGAGISEFDGDWDNDHPAANAATSLGTDDSLGGWDNESYSFSLAATPTDALSIDLGYHHFQKFTESRAQSRLEVGDLNCGGTIFGGPLRGFCGELPDTPLDTAGNPTGFIIDPRSFGLDGETTITRFAITGDINENLSVSFQGGNVEGDVFSVGISDRDPLVGQTVAGNLVNAFTVLPVGEFDYDQAELRFEFQGESGIYAMVGAFYMDGTDKARGAGAYLGELYTTNTTPVTAAVINSAPIGSTFVANIGDIVNVVDTDTETESMAIFGRLAIPLLDDKLTLGLEGRFSDDERTTNIVYNDGTPDQGWSDTYFTPRLTLDYAINDNQLVYFSAAKGQKSGGSNDEISGDLLPSERNYEAEENTTFELGTKNTLLEGSLQVNAAIFHTDWEDMQISSPATNGGFFATAIIDNLGGAKLVGGELEVIYSVNDALTLNAGIGINDTEYDNGVISQRIARSEICDVNNIVCANDGTVGGNELPRSSDSQWNIGAQYDGTISGLEFFVRADYVGQSEQWLSEANITEIPSRELLNLRGGVSSANWSAELWVKNATDEEYVSNAFYIPSPFFVNIVPTWGDRRRAGVTLNYNF